MKEETDWTSTDKELPSLDEIVWTMDSGGHVQKLVLTKVSNSLTNALWFFPDKSMYVYYVPKFWKRIEK